MFFNLKMNAANGLYVVQGELSALISSLKRDHNSYQVNNINNLINYLFKNLKIILFFLKINHIVVMQYSYFKIICLHRLFLSLFKSFLIL